MSQILVAWAGEKGIPADQAEEMAGRALAPHLLLRINPDSTGRIIEDFLVACEEARRVRPGA